MTQYNISYQKDGIYQAILVEAKDEAHAKAYFENHKPTAEIIGCGIATRDDQRPGKPVLTVPEDFCIKTAEEITADIIAYFENNEDAFNDCIEELDSYNGYLGDNRYYSMDELDEFYRDSNPLEILRRAYYGRDDDTWTTDSNGNKTYGEFNPNRDYFYYNGYGNLVSCDYKDYTSLLDNYAIEAMAKNRCYIDSIDNDEELTALFDELEAAEEDK